MILAQDIKDELSLFNNQVFEMVAGKFVEFSYADVDRKVGEIDLPHVDRDEPSDEEVCDFINFEEQIDENFVINEHAQLPIPRYSTLNNLSSDEYESQEIFEVKDYEKCWDKMNIYLSMELKEWEVFAENAETSFKILNWLTTKCSRNIDHYYTIEKNQSEFNKNNSKEASCKANENEHAIKLNPKKNDQNFDQSENLFQSNFSFYLINTFSLFEVVTIFYVFLNAIV